MILKRGGILKFIAGGLAAGSVLAADLPIRDITIYKHGVAYVERAGDLKAGETARLDFKADDMNDVLKSLTITDRNGGKVAGVRYDASDPLEKRLAEFPFTVGAGASLASFLDQAKGARLEMKLGAENVAGTVLSARVVREEKGNERETLVLLLDSGDIRTFDLAAASTVRFSDGKLQGQLRDYLSLLNQSRSKDRRSVFIDAMGAGAKDLRVRYMMPSPVWKSSYRLMFPEKSPSDKGDPTLEGWAIVDNTSGEDWINVRLAVVSGKPVSFITQLYEPKYVKRPFAELAENTPANPLVYQGALDAEESDAPKAKAAAVPGMARVGGAIPLNGREFNQIERLAKLQPSSVASTAAAQQAGELFEYSFATPISVRQGESAMLPFLQQKIGARKLLVYSENYGLNPRDAAELNNNTGKTLDGGPITVYDSGSYAGEALVETMPTSDRRLISYGVDLGTRITTAFDSSEAVVREVHLKNGTLTSKSAIAETKTYTIKNVDAKAKTLVIEHSQRRGYTLLDQKPLETTANAYRFEVKLAASGTEKFPVREERVFDQQIMVSTMAPDVLVSWIQNKAVSDAGRAQLQQIAAKKREIAANDGALKQATDDIAATTQDENRMRSNIESLNRVSGQQDQVQQYARQLAATESKLAGLRDQQSAVQKKSGMLYAELSALLDKLEF